MKQISIQNPLQEVIRDMKNRIIILFLTFSTILCCQENKTKKISQNTMINKVLQDQIKHGVSGEIFETDISTYNYSEIDLDATISILQDELKNNGYKFISNDIFNTKIKKVFKRILVDTTSTKYVYINFNEKCDRKIKFYRNDNSIDLTPYSIYIVKNNNFITQLYAIPEIIDYLKESSDISKIEENVATLPYENNEKIKVLKWKDIPDLKQQRKNNIQTLVHRNKYLFNDNKASLVWLKFNDEYFLESLVTTFGYTEDKELLDWVMQRNRSKAVEFINNNVFVRNCKGELEIREDILKYIEQKTTDEENTHDYAKALYHYEVYENPNKWTEKEAYKILAYKSNTYDYLFMKYKNIRDNNRWNILGSIYYYSNRGDEKEWKEIEKNFEKNNYYNLPHLKEALEYAYIFE